jgi:hypothetical protein
MTLAARHVTAWLIPWTDTAILNLLLSKWDKSPENQASASNIFRQQFRFNKVYNLRF